MLRTTSRYSPPAAGVPSPLLWGTEQCVRERLGGGLSALTLTRRIITFEFALDPKAVVNEFIQWYGPTLRAFASLDETGKTGLRRELETLWTDHNRASDGSTRVQSEYLEVMGVV
jgi:hypothetical protein